MKNKLAELRNKMGWTQQELADRVEVFQADDHFSGKRAL